MLYIKINLGIIDFIERRELLKLNFKRNAYMYFKTFLERHFDVEESVVFGEEDKQKVFPLKRFELYEKGEDCEYMFSLTLDVGTEEEELERRISGETNYKVGNVYSALQHGMVFEESLLRKMIKKGEHIKK